jgi:methylmalonyl-CoA mutase C-terminal domain/subunit
LRRAKRNGVIIMTNRKIRVLLAKPGLDGHDKGVKLVARSLMDSGMEVIYLGLRQDPESMARAAAQEEPSVIGISILSGAHLNLTRKVMERLKDVGCAEIPLIVGGNIPRGDMKLLEDLGAAGVFPVGTKFESIVEWIKKNSSSGNTGN